MSYVPKKVLGVSLLLAGLTGFSGCASKDSQVVSLQDQLSARQERIQELESSRADMQRVLEIKNAQLKREQASSQQVQLAAMQPAPMGADGSSLFPPKARAGECYARVFEPAMYKTSSKQVLKSEASERLNIIPAKYEWVEEQVMVKGPAEKLEVVPAKYEWVEERVMVRSASTRIEQIPAVYGTETERVLDQPAHTVWKKGRGPLEKIDNSTGEIMCLVEIPATYKTLTKRVVKKPASTRTVDIPAEYKMVRKRVMKTPPSTRTVSIPANYKTVRVKKVSSQEKVNRIAIPARYETVTERMKVGGGEMRWRSVLCETNTTPGAVQEIQRALKQANHYHGPIDGVFGSMTHRAVKSYQTSKGLATGGLTMETLQKLGLKLHNNQIVAAEG